MRSTVFLFILLTLWWRASSEVKKIEQSEPDEKRVLIRTKRRWVLSTINLVEEHPGPFPMEITTLFNDRQQNFSVRFQISGQGVTEAPQGLFSINDLTGVVFANRAIDREVYPTLTVDFDVMERSTGRILDKTLAFSVAIKDINDNAPFFTPNTITMTVPENTKEGPLSVSLLAKDIDEQLTDNSRMSMEIVSQEPKFPPISFVTLSNTTYSSITSKLTFTGCFDYDKAKVYKVLAKVKDHGSPSLSSTATVILQITDSNNHAPAFTAKKYNTQVNEMEIREILRVSVTDLDTPNTPASKAIYSILTGDKYDMFQITTDPATNEGVLKVVKERNFQHTTNISLQIGVENQEPLFLCVDGKAVFPLSDEVKKNGAVSVTVQVVDENDPPVFAKEVEKVFRFEEGEPGDLLYTPVVTDEDSDIAAIRYELVEDPAKWMSINPKTGSITTVQRMDRESPFIKNDTYTLVIKAIDDGKPPATGTGTLVVHLGDRNDHTPQLLTNSTVVCSNKDTPAKIKAKDEDKTPYGGPFKFSLADEEQKKNWKVEQTAGEEMSLRSLQLLANGNYSVPLKIVDNQGVATLTILKVELCDCGTEEKCRRLLPRTSSLGGAALGILLLSLLLVPLLSCCFIFTCGKNKMPIIIEDSTDQNLIKYNLESPSEPKTPLSLMLKQNHPEYQQVDQFSFPQQGTIQRQNNFGSFPISTLQGVQVNTMRTYGRPQIQNQTLQSINNGGTIQGWNTYGTRSFKRTLSRSYSGTQDYNLQNQIHLMLNVQEKQQDPQYQPCEYDSEGSSSKCLSLEALSLSSNDDPTNLLHDLGPKFQTLETICQQAMAERNLKM